MFTRQRFRALFLLFALVPCLLLGAPLAHIAWEAEKYNDLDWSTWDAETATWFDSLLESEMLKQCPPSPPEEVFNFSQPLTELPAFLHGATERLPVVLVEGIPTWGLRIQEEVTAAGECRFLTFLGPRVIHIAPAPKNYDPKVWSRKAYNLGRDFPDWVEKDTEMRDLWYHLRGRNRIVRSSTLVAPGRMEEFKTALQKKMPQPEEAINLAKDTDGDGLPDALEVAHFHTNPNARDTMGCGLDDWSKIYLYNLNPLLADNDEDGIPDGEDEAPLTPGPRITITHPTDATVTSHASDDKFVTIPLEGTVELVGETTNTAQRLTEVWVDGENLLDHFYRGGNYHIKKKVFRHIEEPSFIVEATQAGTPVLRSRKVIVPTLKKEGPQLWIKEPRKKEYAQYNIPIRVDVRSEETVVYCNGYRLEKYSLAHYGFLYLPESELNVPQTLTLTAKHPTEGVTTEQITIVMTKFQIGDIYQPIMKKDHRIPFTPNRKTPSEGEATK